MTLSLHEFGQRAECDYTMASRLLSGHRAPSTRLLTRICSAFDLDPAEALAELAKDNGRTDGMHPTFAAYLKERVINVSQDGQEPESIAV